MGPICGVRPPRNGPSAIPSKYQVRSKVRPHARGIPRDLPGVRGAPGDTWHTQSVPGCTHGVARGVPGDTWLTRAGEIHRGNPLRATWCTRSIPGCAYGTAKGVPGDTWLAQGSLEQVKSTQVTLS